MQHNQPKAHNALRLYSYYRSSASYRVRIILHMKEIPCDLVYINLGAGEQAHAPYQDLNQQGLVPALEVNGEVLTQSLAIIEYLDALYPQPPIFPLDPLAKAKILELAYIICMDIHPINNLRVLNYLTNNLKIDDDQRLQWYQHWVKMGMSSVETRLKKLGANGQFCYGNQVTLADICLIPQVYNALRYACDMTEFQTVMSIYENCLKRPEFLRACPEVQKDAV